MSHPTSSPDVYLRRPHIESAPSSSASLQSLSKQEKYRIGSRTVPQSLVNTEHVKAHLGLLAAFKELRQRVETCPDDYLPDIAQFLDGSQRWAWFHRWVKYVKRTELATWVTEEAPPLDVLMMWHAYMLNPTWYAEDCDRIAVLGTLRLLNSYFMPAVILMGDLTLYEPCEERTLTWFEQTDTPFDPLASMSCLLHRATRCPGCGRLNDVPFLNEDGSGYLQRSFRYMCICGLSITKTALAMDKFADDLVANHRSNPRQPSVYLAGTLHTRTNPRDWSRAGEIKNRLAFHDSLRAVSKMLRTEWKHSIKEKFGYSISNLPQMLVLSRTMNAYTDDRPFSVDLVAAVLRQGTFIDAMDSLGWLTPGYFDDNQNAVLLTHALARYHAFLDLLSSASSPFFVPTLDIDIVWHTHQLKGDEYTKESKEFVGWYVDHDDRVEEIYLANGLDETCHAWQERFGMPYMHCGCPLPDEKMSSKLHQITRRLGSSKIRTRATHASEHDAVRARRNHPAYFTDPHEARALELRRRRERDGRRVLEGKMDEELYRRGQMHISTYLMPLPGAQVGPGPSEQWAAPCVVTFPGAFGTTGVGACIAGVNHYV
ncbi:uncharacterized protein B0H18DRAFT_1117024 [Fomitopsis serialis]|uniref:uncharacterized protein n=1 Tax=Fomitopsis serialis TaxID=139415 RepID=UPI002007F0AE|nr:uncharacterized protein B0H18DRAFT_1117024 [Neoantrodia serialis]KAH9930341.1 hypothetical protein B0H18DRAFT_1117024 [Neoantrodia serialis]